MSALQRAIWDEISRIAESYKSELQIAKSQEEAIDKRMGEVFQQSAATRQSQVRLRELETAANTYRGIYETFLSRFTQSVQQQSFPSTEARVISFATPGTKSSPKIGLTLIFGGSFRSGPGNHGGIRPRAHEPSDSHACAAGTSARNQLSCSHSILCFQTAYSAQERHVQGSRSISEDQRGCSIFRDRRGASPCQGRNRSQSDRPQGHWNRLGAARRRENDHRGNLCSVCC